MSRSERILPNSDLLALARGLRGMDGAPTPAAGREAVEPRDMHLPKTFTDEGGEFARSPEGVYPARNGNGNGHRRRFTQETLASMFINERPGENPRMLTEAQARWLQRLGDRINGVWLADHNEPDGLVCGRWEIGPGRWHGTGYQARTMYPLHYERSGTLMGHLAVAVREDPPRAQDRPTGGEGAAPLMRATDLALTAIAHPGVTVGLPAENGQTVAVANVPADVTDRATLGAVALVLADCDKSAGEKLADIRRIIGG